jgi:hypothetical protein
LGSGFGENTLNNNFREKKINIEAMKQQID